jgi:hypothetical protein
MDEVDGATLHAFGAVHVSPPAETADAAGACGVPWEETI